MPSSLRFRFTPCMLTSLLAAGISVPLSVPRVAVAAPVDQSLPDVSANLIPEDPARALALGENYLTGRNAPRDLVRAALLIRHAAEAGDPNAQTQLGMMYQTGAGVPQDPAQALHWYQLGAASGNPAARVNMGILYARGMGVHQDPAFAMQLFREAAEKGYGNGAAFIGEMYLLGCGVEKAPAVAEKWFARGMKMHDSMSSYDLGILYTGELGHARDLAKAASLFRKSTQRRYIPAEYSLGLLLIRNPELALSRGEARKWLELSSQAGFWKADAVLGILSRDGNGTVKDDETALYYFQIAIAVGGEPARKLLGNEVKTVSSRLSSEKAARIASRAAAWASEHPPVFLFEFGNRKEAPIGSSFGLVEPEVTAPARQKAAAPPPA